MRFTNLNKAKLAVELLRIPSAQQTKSKASHFGMLDCSLNKKAADPLAPDCVVNEDITEPSERRAVGDPSCESDLSPGVSKQPNVKDCSIDFATRSIDRPAAQ